ncbi:MAG: IS66-like element accessory protein TnpA [Geminicoccaceae bacterium]
MVDHRCDSEIEVLSAADAARRRHWSDADKLRIVEESFAGYRQASATARRHGISRSLLTVWRRQYRNGDLGGGPSPAFIPLTLSAGSPAPVDQVSLPSNPEARVEIILRNGRRLVVPANVEPEALSRLLPVLERT